MRAKLKNLATGETVEVHSTTAHPSCSYGKAVWVDDENTDYMQVGLEKLVPLYEIEIIDETDESDRTESA